jgi:hypothetical protein
MLRLSLLHERVWRAGRRPRGPRQDRDTIGLRLSARHPLTRGARSANPGRETRCGKEVACLHPLTLSAMRLASFAARSRRKSPLPAGARRNLWRRSESQSSPLGGEDGERLTARRVRGTEPGCWCCFGQLSLHTCPGPGFALFSEGEQVIHAAFEQADWDEGGRDFAYPGRARLRAASCQPRP